MSLFRSLGVWLGDVSVISKLSSSSTTSSLLLDFCVDFAIIFCFITSVLREISSEISFVFVAISLTRLFSTFAKFREIFSTFICSSARTWLHANWLFDTAEEMILSSIFKFCTDCIAPSVSSGLEILSGVFWRPVLSRNSWYVPSIDSLNLIPSATNSYKVCSQTEGST